jgi:hypothetical protein
MDKSEEYVFGDSSANAPVAEPSAAGNFWRAVPARAREGAWAARARPDRSTSHPY